MAEKRRQMAEKRRQMAEKRRQMAEKAVAENPIHSHPAPRFLLKSHKNPHFFKEKDGGLEFFLSIFAIGIGEKSGFIDALANIEILWRQEHDKKSPLSR